MRLKTIIFSAVIALLSLTARGQVANIMDPRLVIALPTPAGDTLPLSSLKGKVVLLDFWASWCIPCRLANRKLVNLYSKYKKDGFEIYSVSVDEERDSWVRAIAKDKIKWLQVNDNAGTMAESVMRWNVSVLPTTFLINRKGDVVAIDLEGRELEKTIRALLKE